MDLPLQLLVFIEALARLAGGEMVLPKLLLGRAQTRLRKKSCCSDNLLLGMHPCASSFLCVAFCKNKMILGIDAFLKRAVDREEEHNGADEAS